MFCCCFVVVLFQSGRPENPPWKIGFRRGAQKTSFPILKIIRKMAFLGRGNPGALLRPPGVLVLMLFCCCCIVLLLLCCCFVVGLLLFCCCCCNLSGQSRTDPLLLQSFSCCCCNLSGQSRTDPSLLQSERTVSNRSVVVVNLKQQSRTY